MEAYDQIDKGFDAVVGADYVLYSIGFKELKEEAKSWYGPDFDFSKYDNRNMGRGERDEMEINEMKKAGLLCNLFFAYLEDGKYYLLDGFNRLFTNYVDIDIKQTVYLKVITSKLEDHELISTMFKLNLWKLYGSFGMSGGFKIDDFLDRGFRLLLKSKYDIEFYNYPDHSEKGWYDKRTRDNEDLRVLDSYFVNEQDFAGYFKLPYYGVAMLLSNVNIINDFRNILKANDYRHAPFKNYDDFLKGYIFFLTHIRLNGENRNIFTFDYFLEKLYADKKFFTKLQGMVGNDSTRKNIYKWFRELKLE